LPKKPATDQDFANLADAVKRLEQAEKELDAEENRALASLKPVNDMRTAKATLKEFSRTNRLAFNTLVETQKKLLRTEILMEHQQAYLTWVAETNKLLGAALLVVGPTIPAAAIAEGMSGKKSINGWREGAAQAVADAKVKVNAIVQKIQANQLAYKELATEEAHQALFRDLNELLFKDCEAFRVIVGGRISDWNAKEEKRLADERAKIRAEEEAKAAEKLRQEPAAATPAPTPAPRGMSEGEFNGMRERDNAGDAPFGRAAAVQGGTPVPPHRDVDVFTSTARAGAYGFAPPTPARVVRNDLLEEASRRPALTPDPLPLPATGNGPTITVTQINTRLKFTVTAGFLESVGITPASTEGNARRYLEADFPRICIAIRNHLLGVMTKKPETVEA
jgi:hypothetical protein